MFKLGIIRSEYWFRYCCTRSDIYDKETAAAIAAKNCMCKEKATISRPALIINRKMNMVYIRDGHDTDTKYRYRR